MNERNLGDRTMRLKIQAAVFFLLTACSESGTTPPPVIPNSAPIAQAQSPAQVVEGETVTLSGAQSSDPDGVVSQFSWRQVSGPSVSLGNANTANATFQAPLVNVASSLTFELTVTDEDGASNADTVSTTIEIAPRSTIVEIETVFDGEARAYSVYTPANYQAGAPAVVLLHGGGSGMRTALGPFNTTRRWVDHAESDGFLLIAPNGYNETRSDGLGDQQSWNDIRDDLSGRTSLEDDTGFILALLDDIQAAREHDPTQVFVTGSSNGGFMTFGLLIEQSSHFIGGASFIAALPEEVVPNPLSPTPVMILNGTNDLLVRFQGGPVGEDGAPSRSVQDTIDYWLANNEADVAAAISTQLPDRAPADGCQIIETTYPSLINDDPAVLVYIALGGGHNIPDPNAPNFTPENEPILGPRCRDVDGVDLAFQFFQTLTN